MVTTSVILVVDDEKDARDFLRAILESKGYQVIEADSGKQALETAGRLDTPLELMITDLLMPRMHGRELALRMRSMLPHLKILYVSGYSQEVLFGLNLCPDPAALLRKPLDPRSTLDMVQRMLSS